jgi:transcription elongation GreA/GreB family factor
MSDTDYKTQLVSALRSRLTSEIATMTRLAVEAAEAASHEENKPENDKDMRSTEASYLAKGQADRVQSLERALALLAAMPIRHFNSGESIQASALIDVRRPQGERTYFLVPALGGEQLEHDGREIHTLATTSPLGRSLLGLMAGDEAEVVTPQGTQTYEVASVR